MYSLYYSIRLLLLSFCLFVVACGESPKSSSSAPKKSIIQVKESEPEPLELNALKYEGSDATGRKCDLYIALHEEEEDEGHEEEHAHHLLMKVDYTTLDGHRPHAAEGEIYLYDETSGLYYDEESEKENSIATILSLSLKDEDKEADKNKISDYISKAELEQYIRVQFDEAIDLEAYEEALEELVEEEASIKDHKDSIDVINLISMAVAHGDHYHFPTCTNFKAVGVEKTTYELDEDHDHDHDEK